jgi:NAD(P)-dependent dehydrogenase (short-subunit alcohol dehydrogenase family)
MNALGAAVVTGAGSGIGRAVAIALGRRGLDVALLGRTEATLRATAEEVERAATRTIVIRADVSVEEDVERAARAVTDFLGAPSVVVNNAGIAGRKAPIEEITPSEWDAVIAANLRGVFLMTRAFLPAMRAGAGRRRLVTIASISSTLGTAGLSAYCAAKWGALGFTKALAEELRESGMQAMAVLPGSVDTPMIKVGGFAPQMKAEDIAGLVAYAALDAPDAMNGSAIECFGS